MIEICDSRMFVSFSYSVFWVVSTSQKGGMKDACAEREGSSFLKAYGNDHN